MWVRHSFPSRGERLKWMLLSGHHPLQFTVAFIVSVAIIAALHSTGIALPLMPAQASLPEAIRTAWWVPIGAGAIIALFAQAVARLLDWLRRRRSLELRLCPGCGRVYPRVRIRCEKCGMRLADAEHFTWRAPHIPVPPNSDFTGESPFD